MLLPAFYNTLLKGFDNERVKVAPVKQLQRCKAKLDEYKNNGSPPPYAACVCDFLRATVLCKDMAGVVDALYELSKHFTIVRVKPRLDLNIPGNKVVLVNVVVEDSSIKPHTYTWSGWWDEQNVRMIAEVSHIRRTYTRARAYTHMPHIHRRAHVAQHPHGAHIPARAHTHAHTPA